MLKLCNCKTCLASFDCEGLRQESPLRAEGAPQQLCESHDPTRGSHERKDVLGQALGLQNDYWRTHIAQACQHAPAMPSHTKPYNQANTTFMLGYLRPHIYMLKFSSKHAKICKLRTYLACLRALTACVICLLRRSCLYELACFADFPCRLSFQFEIVICFQICFQILYFDMPEN